MAEPLRYVVLRHEGIDDPHFDVMFETSAGAPLKTFRSPEWPIVRATKLTPLPDHRSAYLTYEGPISGERGVVRRIVAGTYEARPQWDDPAVFDVCLIEPSRLHLWLVGPPHEEAWLIEPALY